MVTTAPGSTPARTALTADRYERLLAIASIVLLVAVLAAIARGEPYWGRIPAAVWLHLATMLVALALTPVILLGRRGSPRHRMLGRVWIIAMLATTIVSFFVRFSRPGHLGPIHILSLYVLIQAPLIWWNAANHRVARHRGQVRGMVTGALLIAGFFTFPFHRLLGGWLFG